ncbi:MAG: GspH/FimT family pseudopilin [Hyphomicrobiaceae bacterium]
MAVPRSIDMAPIERMLSVAGPFVRRIFTSALSNIGRPDERIHADPPEAFRGGRTPVSAGRGVTADRLCALRPPGGGGQNPSVAEKGREKPLDNIADHCSNRGGRRAAAASWLRGFTLIELMIVVAILAILLGLAAPYMQEFYVRNRLESTTNDLAAALATARNEAMRRGVPITLRSTAGSSNWSNGWTLCVDSNPAIPAGTCAAGATTTIRTGGALSTPLTAYSNATFSGAVTFDSGGRVVNTAANGATTYPGIIVICHGGSFAQGGRARSRAILVNAVGRIRVGLDANGDGIPEGDGTTNIGGTCTAPTP